MVRQLRVGQTIGKEHFLRFLAKTALCSGRSYLSYANRSQSDFWKLNTPKKSEFPIAGGCTYCRRAKFLYICTVSTLSTYRCVCTVHMWCTYIQIISDKRMVRQLRVTQVCLIQKAKNEIEGMEKCRTKRLSMIATETWEPLAPMNIVNKHQMTL